MKPLSLLIVISLLSLFSTTSCSQSSTNDDSIICQEWKLVFYEENGEKFPPAPSQQGSRMIFYPDHKVKSIEPDIVQHGVWKYDAAHKLLSITDNDTGEIFHMKIIRLAQNEMVVEMEDSGGPLLKIYMESVAGK